MIKSWNMNWYFVYLLFQKSSIQMGIVRNPWNVLFFELISDHVLNASVLCLFLYFETIDVEQIFPKTVFLDVLFKCLFLLFQLKINKNNYFFLLLTKTILFYCVYSGSCNPTNVAEVLFVCFHEISVVSHFRKCISHDSTDDVWEQNRYKDEIERIREESRHLPMSHSVTDHSR